jgi:hypothetical protein
MSLESFEEVLDALVAVRPFQFFTIELKNGKRLEIDNYKAFSYRNGTAHFFSPGGMPIWFDHDSVSHIFPAPANSPA